MKKVFPFLLAILCLAILLQCKKNPPAGTAALPSEDSDSGFVSGRYIIRTKYCANGTAFALRTASNFEVITLEAMKAEDLAWIKTADDYIWNVEAVRATGFPVFPPAGSNDYTIFAGYRIYQQDVAGNSFQSLAMFRPGDSNHDEVGDGSGPNQWLSLVGLESVPNEISAQTNCFACTEHPNHELEVGWLFAFVNNGKGGYKIRHSEKQYNCGPFDTNRWWFTTTHDGPDGTEDCNWAQRLTIRPPKPNTTIVGNTQILGYYPDCGIVTPPGDGSFRRCFTDDFYFEKVD